jgi:hypothetical protein
LLQTNGKLQFERTVEALFSRVSPVQSRTFLLEAYSVFKDHPPDTPPPDGQCGTLSFVRFYITWGKKLPLSLESAVPPTGWSGHLMPAVKSSARSEAPQKSSFLQIPHSFLNQEVGQDPDGTLDIQGHAGAR